MNGKIILGLTVLILGFFIGYNAVFWFAADPNDQDVSVQFIDVQMVEKEDEVGIFSH